MKDMRIGGLEDNTNGTVVTMLDSPDHADVALLESYWRELCGERPMPERTDIDPVKIPALLPYLLIADELPPDGPGRIRLFGTGLVRLFGEDRTGKYLNEIGAERTDNLTGLVQNRWNSVLERLMHLRGPTFATTRLVNLDKAYVRIHIGAFPLTGSRKNTAGPPVTEILAIIRPS